MGQRNANCYRVAKSRYEAVRIMLALVPSPAAIPAATAKQQDDKYDD